MLDSTKHFSFPFSVPQAFAGEMIFPSLDDFFSIEFLVVPNIFAVALETSLPFKAALPCCSALSDS